ELTHKIKAAASGKRADDALRRSEERYRNIVEDQTELISRFTPDGIHVFVNEAYCRYFGMKREDILGHRFRPEIPKEDKERVQQFFASLTTEHPVDIIEHYIIMPDGSVRWQRWSDRAIFDDSGTLIEYQSVGRDITEKKQAENERTEYQTRLKEVIEFLPDATLAIDRQKRIIVWNKAIEQMSGIPAAEMIGKGDYAYAVPFYGEARPLLMDLVLEYSEELAARYPAIRREGDALMAEVFCNALYNNKGAWVFVKASPLYDSDGNIIGAIESIRDITGRRQVEEALIQERNFSNTLFDAPQDTVFLFDPATGKPVRWNRRFSEESGYTDDEIAGMIAPRDFYDEEDYKKAKEVMAGNPAGNITVELSLVTKQGERVPFEYSATSIKVADGGTLLLSIGRNITERRRAEEALQQSEEKYRSLFDNAILGIFRTTPAGQYLDMNAAFARIAGYDSPEEMKAAIHDIGKQLYVRPEDRQKIGELLTLNGEIRNFETEIRHRDDHSIWITINATNVRNENGSVLWWDGTIEDITARKVAEQSLQESEALLRDIIEKNPMSIQIVDREGFTLNVNPAFMRLFGSVPPPDYSIITDLVKSRPELANLISQVKSGEAVNLPDMSFNAHDIYPELPDVPTRVRAIIFPLNDRYGKPERFVFMHENITGQKQAEEALQGSRRILETVIDNVPSRVFWKDKNLTYLGCNTAFARDAGFDKPEDVIGKDDFAMGWRNQAELYRADDRYVIESGSAKLLIEEPQTTPSGEQISLLTSKVPLRDATGNIIGVLGTYLDVTERNRTVAALTENEERLRTTLEILPVGVFIFSKNGQILTANAMVNRIWGVTDGIVPHSSGMEEFVEYKGYWPDTGVALRPGDWAASRVLMKGEKAPVDIVNIQRFDGSFGTIIVSAVPYHDDRGNVTGAVAVIEDITESRRAEEALLKNAEELHAANEQLTATEEELRQNLDDLSKNENVLQESEDRFRGIFDTITSGVAIYEVRNDGASGKDYIIKDFNKTALEIEGKKKEEVVGKSLFDLRPAIDEYGLIPVFQQVWETVVPAYFPQKVYIDENYSRWYENRVFRLPGGEIVAVYDDVTERKQAELELESALENLKEAHHLAHIGTWDWIMATDTVIWSEELYTIFRRDRSLPAPTYAEHPRFYSPASWEQLNDAVTRALTTGEPYNLELEMIRSDGSTRWVNALGGVKRDGNKKITGLHGTVQDITKRKLLDDTRAFLVQCGYPGSGEDFFNALARYLAERLDMSYVCIDTLEGDGLTAQTVAIYNDGKFDTNVRYALQDTPCGDVVGKTICCFQQDVCRLFPHDAALQDLKAESYVGTTLWGSDHTPIGLIALIGRKPLKDPALAQAVLELVAVRAAGEMERQRAEEALRESEEKYRTLVEKANEAIIIAQDGVFAFANRSMSELLGVPVMDLEGQPFIDYIWPDDREWVVANYTKRISGVSIPDSYDFRIIGSGGRLMWVSLSAAVIQWKGKTATLNLITDITERKVAEEKLLETTEYLQNLFDYANAPIIVWDPEYVITRFNHAFEDLTLISEQEVIGQKLDILFPEESRDTSLFQIKKTLEGERWETVEIPILIKDGSVRTVLWNSANILNPHGGIISTIAQGVDITDRKVAEDALKEREEELLEAQKIAKLGKWELDLVNNTLHWSDGIYEMFEINPAQFMATYEAFLNCIHPDDRDMVNSAYAGSLKNRQPYEISHRLRMGDGRIKWVNEICHTEYNAQGQPLRSVGIVQDISGIKQAEEALIFASKKLNLLSSITRHDINNQLTVLQGYLALLKKKQPDSSFAEYFVKINAAAERISAMILFTREYENIGVNAPVWQGCDTFIETAMNQASLGNVRVINEIPAGTKIFADPLIVKVFFNLMDNAVRHGGKVTTIRFSVDERNGDHVVVCKDDGDGVVADEKEKIFMKGYGKNTGMGLFLSKEILSITGITISETGEPGNGARFEMTVPKGAWRTAGNGA
ncbi:MAG: PAS domain S-box protein, partial [Methanoregula sp.]|nr:PAS domain S-box protein [Methanoregula sp.]